METPLKKDRCNSDAEDPELEKIYLDQSNPSAGNGPDYKRYLKGGFVLSVISITVGVALHIIEYAMRANSLGKSFTLNIKQEFSILNCHLREPD